MALIDELNNYVAGRQAVRDARTALESAETALQNYVTSLGDFIWPEDGKVGESFTIVHGTSLVVVSMPRVGEYRVHIRKRGSL